MSEQPLDAIERDALCDLFLEVGPEAPTLCEGWTTLDLAAHLVMRERDLRSGLVIMGGRRFAKLGERLMTRYRSRGYENLVDRLRHGPRLIPWRLPGLRTLLNLNEWFVHHEDVRRANGRDPRPPDEQLDAALWKNLARVAPLALRKVKGVGVEAAAPGHGSRRLRRGTPAATIGGPPPELVLFVNGRRSAAQVELGGDTAALETLSACRLGV